MDHAIAATSRQQTVIIETFGKEPSAEIAIVTTEIRHGTVQGCGGHYQCRRIPVTLPYSGTLQ